MNDPLTFAPIVFYGTATSDWSKAMNGYEGTVLVFQIVDPTFRFPMTWKVYSARFNYSEFWGFGDADERRAQLQSEEVRQFFLKLACVQGLARLWITPSSLLIQGYPEHYDKVSEKVRAAMTEIFGDFEFHNVPHGEAFVPSDMRTLFDAKTDA